MKSVVEIDNQMMQISNPFGVVDWSWTSYESISRTRLAISYNISELTLTSSLLRFTTRPYYMHMLIGNRFPYVRCQVSFNPHFLPRTFPTLTRWVSAVISIVGRCKPYHPYSSHLPHLRLSCWWSIRGSNPGLTSSILGFTCDRRHLYPM